MKADGGVKWINSNIIKHQKEFFFFKKDVKVDGGVKWINSNITKHQKELKKEKEKKR